MKIVFMGTPDIAANALKELLRQNLNIVAVFTREDKPVGRKKLLTAPPVKLLAMQHGIDVQQPKNLRSSETAALIAGMQPSLIVVVAYGRILPAEILQIPKYGCVNLHVSLLPSYRGAAPVQWAVINGEKTTGVSIMQLDEGLDTGPVLAQQVVDILPDESAGDIFAKVGDVGAKLLCQTIKKIAQGQAKALPQSGPHSLAPPLGKQMAEIDFAKKAAVLHNLVRGCNPWPLAWFCSGGKKIKLLSTQPLQQSGRPGQVLSLKPLVLACGEGALMLKHVVPEGAKQMDGSAWAMGRRLKLGDFLP